MSNDPESAVSTHIQTACEKLGVISDRLIEVRDEYNKLLDHNLGDEPPSTREEKSSDPDQAVGGLMAEVFNQLNAIVTIIDSLSRLNNRHRGL